MGVDLNPQNPLSSPEELKANQEQALDSASQEYVVKTTEERIQRDATVLKTVHENLTALYNELLDATDNAEALGKLDVIGQQLRAIKPN